MSWKETGFKIWHFLWKENSWQSWIANIILAFVLIKFIVYPGLGFLLGTSYPVVAVVSGSMEHDGTFDTWWGEPRYLRLDGTLHSQEEWYNDHGITYNQFLAFSLKNGFNKGDIMILAKTKPTVGDVIVYRTNKLPEPVIHRVINKSATTFTTKGDHNADNAEFEKNIPAEQVIGTAVFRIPYLGWMKIGFVQLLELTGVR